MSSDGTLYRAIWRWHFYAGLIVAPFLLILSVTGAIYLFKSELNDALMPKLQHVEAVANPMPPSHLIHAALSVYPGQPTRIDMPAATNRPATVYVVPESGEALRVSVDPGTGSVLGSIVYSHTLVGFAESVHGTLALGDRGDALVELSACWALVLIASGAYLWWPRGRSSLAGVLWPRLTARGRTFWRDLHAVTGIWTVALIAFLILTGLPWAIVQGPLVRGVVAALGIGNAAQDFDYKQPRSKTKGEALGSTPWSQETLPMPESDPAHAEHRGATHQGGPDHAAIVGADAIVMKARALGYPAEYQLVLPAGTTGVYTVMNFPGRPQEQRVLQFDRWTETLLSDNGWRQYGIGARAIELGVQIHQGRFFGFANQLLMLLPCIGIVTLVVTGVTMWWRRRPTGSLGAPPPVSGARLRGVLTILVIASCLMPLFGASLLLLLIFELVRGAVLRRAPA